MSSQLLFERPGVIGSDDLRLALNNQQFSLLYQPKLDCRTGTVVGAEALMRWTHPWKGLVPPSRFIPVAEQSDLIHDLGQWILRAACRQLRLWRDAEASDWSIAINVSPSQLLRPGFYASVSGALSEHGIPADRLVLEITESALMADHEPAVRQLFKLFGLGVQVSLDDFGTGFSSLSRLKQMPVHEVKIAREFIEELDRSEADRAIVAAIIRMCGAMHLRVVAEGVEREGQRACLQQMGCDLTQGFLHAPPVRADVFQRRFGRTSGREVSHG